MTRVTAAELLGRPITEERIINAMKVLAYIMASRPDGDMLSPIFERLERELEDRQRRQAPVDRAKRFLERYTVDGTVNAIR